jgi:glycerol uptake facilitator-like aquaporin
MSEPRCVQGGHSGESTVGTPPGLEISSRRDEQPLWARLLAEGLGSAFLALVVIGSGIAAQHLSPGDKGLELLENAGATATGLYAIILMIGPVSGAHLNPVVSLADAAFGGISWKVAFAYLFPQVAGCVLGAIAANIMFGLAPVSISSTQRGSGAHFFSETIATLGLLLVIFALARSGRSQKAPAAVGAYIGAAYWFTSSTSFANPAITVGRMLSNSFAGIAPSSVPTFVAAQLVGLVLAIGLIKVLYPKMTQEAAAAVVIAREDAFESSSASHFRSTIQAPYSSSKESN